MGTNRTSLFAVAAIASLAAFMPTGHFWNKRPYIKTPKKGGAGYYKERNFDSCPRPPTKLSPTAKREPVRKCVHGHAGLTREEIPRRKDGNKLGLRQRREIAVVLGVWCQVA